jgi:DNA transposition AAA+ family ATPase
MLTPNQKKDIKKKLEDYITCFESQSKAASTLEDISEATVIQILKSKWDDISDAMWVNLNKQLIIAKDKRSIVETSDVRLMIDWFDISRETGVNFCIIGNPGSSKTSASDYYACNNIKTGVYHIKCSEYFNKKQFLSRILSKMGEVNTGYNIGEMMGIIVRKLRRQHQPLLILDEIDKVDDKVFCFYITLYNELEGLCGICLTGTDFLKKRIMRGIERNAKGYKEIYSRIGSKFMELDGTNYDELEEICITHGITDSLDIREIYNSYEGDLRAVDWFIIKKKLAERQNKKYKS